MSISSAFQLHYHTISPLNMFAATLTLRRVWLQVAMKIKLMLLPQPTNCSWGWRILIPHEDIVGVITPVNILFRGGSEIWPLMKIKLMLLPQSTYCSEEVANFNVMMIMMRWCDDVMMWWCDDVMMWWCDGVMMWWCDDVMMWWWWWWWWWWRWRWWWWRLQVWSNVRVGTNMFDHDTDHVSLNRISISSVQHQATLQADAKAAPNGTSAVLKSAPLRRWTTCRLLRGPIFFRGRRGKHR